MSKLLTDLTTTMRFTTCSVRDGRSESFHGQALSRWLVLISFAAASSVCAVAAELSEDGLFDPDRVVDVVIELPAEDWRLLCKQTRDMRTAFANPSESPFSYFKGSVTIDGVKIESVGIRKKGFIGSLDDQWPSLKVKFDEYVKQQPVEGIDVLTLNNNKQDPSLLSQFLAYRLFNAAGVHAPRSNFARVTVNGEYLGIYSNVESIGKPFLKRRFGDDSGNLYEGTLADFYPSAIDRLEAKTNEKTHDRSKVMRLAKLLAADEGIALDQIGDLVDIDYFLKFWAMESLIGFWDGYSNNQNNYWVYNNRDNGKFYFMPWGADGAFMGARGPFGFGPPGPTSVYTESMLANRLYQEKSVADRYRATMLQLLETAWNEDELMKLIDRAEGLVSPHLHDRQVGAPNAMNGVRQFIRSRRETITRELQNWPVQVASQPRKPMYAVELGMAKGSFATQWYDEPVKNPLEVGHAEMRLEMEGAVISFKQLGVTAHLAQLPRFAFGGGPPGRPPGGRGGPPRRPPPPVFRPGRGPGPADGPRMMPRGGGPFGPIDPPATIVLTAVRDSDSRKLTLTLSIDPDVFRSSAGKTVAVNGTLADGDGGGNVFMPFGGRVVEGKLTLSRVGMKSGDAVEGEFDVKIAETRGGFMDRREAGRPRARDDRTSKLATTRERKSRSLPPLNASEAEF